MNLAENFSASTHIQITWCSFSIPNGIMDRLFIIYTLLSIYSSWSYHDLLYHYIQSSSTGINSLKNIHLLACCKKCISFVFIQISAFGIWKENRNIKHSFALPQGNFKWWRLLNHHFFKMFYRNFENVQHQQRYKRTNTGMSKNNDESDQLLIYQRFQDILIFLFNLSIINWVYISFLSWSKLKDIEIQLNAVRSFKCFYTLRLWKLEVLVLFVRILEFFFSKS